MTKDKYVNVGIIYNAFDPSDIQKDQLVWNKRKQLRTYLKGLPDDVEWKIAINGVEVNPKKNPSRTLNENDVITLVVVPQGSGAKNILRMVALIVLVVAAFVLFAPLAAGGLALAGAGMGMVAASTAFMMVGGFIINALLAPKVPKSDTDPETYGYDGAKNTARQGVALPVVYGEFRSAGNYVDLYTANVGDDQYLYGRTVVSDGEIESISLPKINDQPIDNFSDVDWDFNTGTENEDINPWFGRSSRQVSKGIKLTSDWLTHTTTEAIDKIQLNLQFPRGLVHITKKGKKRARTATVEIEYKKSTDSTWSSFRQNTYVETALPSDTTPLTKKLKIGITPTLAGDESYNFTIEYKKPSDASWTVYKTVTGSSEAANFEYEEDIEWTNTILGLTVSKNPYPNRKVYEFPVVEGTYQVRSVGGTVNTLEYASNGAIQSVFSWTDRRAKTLRKTIESNDLEYDVYDVRIKKTSAEGNQETNLDEIYLSDVGEITTLGVPLNYIANAYYRVKMTEQLNGIPNATWLVKGVKMNQYDVNGNVVSYLWSDNPADIILDMMIGDRRGSGKSYTIDYPAFYEWRQHCEDEGLKFNGVMDSTVTLWDAAQTILRVGRAAFTRVGTKLSVAIDKPKTPSMLFGPGNIYKDSFSITYMPLTDRATELEVSYFDKDDDNKQKTIRVVDPLSENNGDMVKAVSYQLVGVNNFEQAHKEAWYQIYNNRYLKKTVQLDAPIESIALSIGDIALIQHDLVNWGYSGRIERAVDKTQIILDKPITLDANKDYALLVIHDKQKLFTGELESSDETSNQYVLKHVSEAVFDNSKAKRLVVGVEDIDILSISSLPYGGSSGYRVMIKTNGFIEAIEGTVISIYDTDVIEEIDVINMEDEYTVNLDGALANKPKPFSNYMLGDKTSYKKPFMLKSVTGDGYEKRTLGFIEYNESIFDEPERSTPAPAPSESKEVTQVKQLLYSYDTRATDINTNIAGVISWNSGSIRNYGGADIYVGLNESEYVFYKTVFNVSETNLDVHLGDDVAIKVVAFNINGVRANSNRAPYLVQTIQAAAAYIEEPTSLDTTDTSNVGVGTAVITWTHALDYTVTWTYRVQIKFDGDTEWTECGVTPQTFFSLSSLLTGTYDIRIRSENTPSYSVWVEDSVDIAAGIDGIGADTDFDGGTA